MDEAVHIVSLRQKPCVVQYLDQYDKFLVGTYELFTSIEDARLRLSSHMDHRELSKTLERINYRGGSLVLMGENDFSIPSIEYEFDCHLGGGIFDFKVKYNKVDSSYNIYVAHSNGTIGIYKLSLNCGNKIYLREQINVMGSIMLTSIDIIADDFCTTNGNGTHEAQYHSSSSSVSSSISSLSSSMRFEMSMSHSNKLVVGDSDGFVTTVNSNGFIREDVGQGDSIWQVKSFKLESGRDVIIAGAENSSWYMYGIDEYQRKLVLLYKNSYKDFNAGVTSISILDVVHSNEYDLVKILLGSYDETLQTYHVKINHDGCSKPDVCHKDTVSIRGGGIWRIKPIQGTEKRQMCVAAMYAGSYILSLDIGDDRNVDQFWDSTEKTLTKLIDIESLELSQKPLHYDIDVSSCKSTFCIVDFNNSLCLFRMARK